MVTHMKRSFAGLAVLCLVAAMPLTYACDKVPLLAPSGSSISLFAAANTVPLNGDIEIVANVIENGGTATTPSTPATGNNGTTTTPGTGTTSTTSPGAGTPVQNGTLVSFTTTIGRIEPSEARTSNGQVRVRFFAGTQSGTATITAFSGGSSGKLENLKVGAAAVDHFTVSANPQTLGPAGGTSTITAHVEDASGAGVAGVNVTFSTDNGSVNPGNATTDASGNASTTLNTPRTAKVAVTVAGKDAKEITVGLNPRTGITISAAAGQTSVGLPVTFNITVGQTANIRNVIVDFGDGSQIALGAISGPTTIQHTYSEPATYTVRATATDTSDFTEQVSTAVTILPAQAPSVTIQGPQTAKINEAVTFIANVTGTISTIKEFQWDFGEGANPRFVTTSSSRQSTTYTTAGTKSVTVHVVQNIGPAGDGTTVITISLTLR
jgi:Big-like domain-containing protein/PKD domain-containing protein